MPDITWNESINLDTSAPIAEDGNTVYSANSLTTGVDQYDALTDTETSLTSVTSMSGRAVVFGGQLYVARAGGSSGSRFVQVLRWNGSSWDTVLSLSPTDSHLGGAGLTIDGSAIYLFSSILPSSIFNVNDQYAKYSTDGTTWNDCTIVGNPDATRTCFRYTQAGAVDPDQLSVPTPFVNLTRRTNLSTSVIALWSLNNGTVTYEEDTAYIVTANGPLYWRENSSTGFLQKSSGLTGAWINASVWANGNYSTHQLVENHGFTDASFSCLISGTNPYTTSLYRWDDALLTWELWDAVKTTSDNDVRVNTVTLLDNNLVYAQWAAGFAEGWSVSDLEIDPEGNAILPPDEVGARLYIFKGNGIEWTSRGLKTSA